MNQDELISFTFGWSKGQKIIWMSNDEMPVCINHIISITDL